MSEQLLVAHRFVAYRVELPNSTRFGSLLIEATPSEAWRCLDEGTARRVELLKLWPQATDVMVVQVRRL